jgi:hypothetical protein
MAGSLVENAIMRPRRVVCIRDQGNDVSPAPEQRHPGWHRALARHSGTGRNPVAGAAGFCDHHPPTSLDDQTFVC